DRRGARAERAYGAGVPRAAGGASRGTPRLNERELPDVSSALQLELQQRPLDDQHPPLGHRPAVRREPAELSARGEHAVTGHNDRDGLRPSASPTARALPGST